MAKVGIFLKGVKSELKKVRWSSKKELVNYTKIVLATVFLLTVFIYASDTLISYVVEVILSKLS